VSDKLFGGKPETHSGSDSDSDSGAGTDTDKGEGKSTASEEDSDAWDATHIEGAEGEEGCEPQV